MYEEYQQEGLQKDAIRSLDYNEQYFAEKRIAKELLAERKKCPIEKAKKSYRTGDKHNTIYFR